MKVCSCCGKEHEVQKFIEQGKPWYFEPGELLGWLYDCDCRGTMFVQNPESHRMKTIAALRQVNA